LDSISAYSGRRVDPADLNLLQPFDVTRSGSFVAERYQRESSFAIAKRLAIALEGDDDATADRRIEKLAPRKQRLVAVARDRDHVGPAKRARRVAPDVGLLQHVDEAHTRVGPSLRQAAASRELA
jgi:hypothetical protein